MMALLLTACWFQQPPTETGLSVGDSGDPCFRDAPTLEIGSGEVTWETLQAGDPVTMVHGPQGGWHILGSARVAHTDAIVRINFSITVQESGAVIADNTYTVQMIMDADCEGYYPGMYGYLDVSALAEGELDTPPELLSETPVVLHMRVEDLNGRSTTAQLDVIAMPDPMDVEGQDTGGPSK